MNSPGQWRDAAGALDLIKSGMTVGLGHVGAEPLSLTAGLWERKDRLRDITLLTGMMLTGYPFLGPDYREAFRLKTWFMPGTLLSADMRDIAADYLPMNWMQTARYLGSAGIDVALVQVSEADSQGFHSMGISVGLHAPLIRGAKLVIAEVNPAMPRTRGQSLIHTSEIGVLVKAEHPLIPFPNRDADEVDRRIALNAARFVEDGASIQFGIGAIPSAMLEALIALGRKDLRIISQITDPARKLIEAGACTTDGPAAVIGEVLGSEALYRWSHENPALHMVDAFSTHKLESLLPRGRFISVNSTLEIDLYGQINSETLDGRQVGAIGGSLDFAMGAQLQDNLSVIALRATTKKGKSRVVPCLSPGPVTLPRSLVQVVVTENGVADLRNKTMRERAIALAHVADEASREDLLRHAASIQ